MHVITYINQPSTGTQLVIIITVFLGYEMTCNLNIRHTKIQLCFITQAITL